MPVVRPGSSCLHAKALPDNPYDGHTSRPSSKLPSVSPAAPSSAAMSTRDTAARHDEIPSASSSPARSAAASAVIERELQAPLRHRSIIGHLKVGRTPRTMLPQGPRTATPPMPSSPQSATTSASSSPGSENHCTCSWSSYGERSQPSPRSILLLNGRLQMETIASIDGSGISGWPRSGMGRHRRIRPPGRRNIP